MPEVRFDEVIHAPLRLRICGLLHPVERLDFAVLRTALEVSNATLSKHLKTLSESGYVLTNKAAAADRADARRIMWLSLSRTGRAAFEAHVRALQEIAGTAGK